MEKITITADYLQEWYDTEEAPIGFEDFELETDTDTGTFDSEKGSMIDYEITITNTITNETWVGIGGYYNANCGEKFNYDIKFEKYVEVTWESVNDFLKKKKVGFSDEQLKVLKRNFSVPDKFN